MTPQPQKPRVLVVDDREANRVAYDAILSQDYTLSLAASGQQALTFAKTQEFAVVLLDIRMPEMDGYETAEALRKLESMRYTPIIFLSAYDQDVIEVRRCYVAGAVDFVSSPVDEELLKFKVAAYVQMFLKNEALRIQIHGLGNLLQQLQVEMSRQGPAQSTLQSKVSELESAIDDLKRQMIPVPP